MSAKNHIVLVGSVVNEIFTVNHEEKKIIFKLMVATPKPDGYERSYFSIVAHNKIAEIIIKNAKKGTQMIVQGWLENVLVKGTENIYTSQVNTESFSFIGPRDQA